MFSTRTASRSRAPTRESNRHVLAARSVDLATHRPELSKTLVGPRMTRDAGRRESTASQKQNVALPERPARLYRPSPPALRLPGHGAFQTGLRRTTSRRPVVVPVGRSVGVDRVRTSRKTHPAADRPPFP